MPQQYMLVFTVPVTHADAVREAVGKAGAGKQGNYSFCSFSTKGTGRFLPEAGANPATGTIGKLEEVEEERVECLCDAERVDAIIAALKAAHPYEEPAFALYPIEKR